MAASATAAGAFSVRPMAVGAEIIGLAQGGPGGRLRPLRLTRSLSQAAEKHR